MSEARPWLLDSPGKSDFSNGMGFSLTSSLEYTGRRNPQATRVSETDVPSNWDRGYAQAKNQEDPRFAPLFTRTLAKKYPGVFKQVYEELGEMTGFSPDMKMGLLITRVGMEFPEINEQVTDEVEHKLGMK